MWIQSSGAGARRARGGIVAVAAACVAVVVLLQNRHVLTQSQSPCGPTINPIVCENQNAGSPVSEWDISGAGDTSIQGFPTNISVTPGQQVSFKIKTPASSYAIDIYRMGYYGGMGARKIASVTPTATLPQTQPACLTQAASGLMDCGNWAVSASWAVPATAVSGIYFAKLKSNTGDTSHIVFVVRDDVRHSDLLFQTSDTTWQAYNQYGGNSLYVGGPGTNPGRAYKVSYNRPITTRGTGAQDFVFNAEYPMVRWMEANGYDVSYTTGIDTDRFGSLLLNHKVFLSVGHDEYWSGQQRTNVEAARAAGINLAFFSGNEVYWKTRWENSIDGSSTAYRTLVTYKETHANAVIDPATPIWTGTWGDPRFSPPGDGNRPQNALTGTMFGVNDGNTTAITVPAALGKHRFWRNTTVATLAAGGTATFPDGTLGYEWDADIDNGFRPAGLTRLSQTTRSVGGMLLDYGSTFGPGTVTHALTLYRQPGGGLVFGAGTVQWTWGLDASHDRAGTTTDLRMQQATVNLFADMGAQAGTLQAGLVPTGPSADAVAPTSTITSPTAGTSVTAGAPLTISGSASDASGIVTVVEISTDGGTTWKPATGTTSWTFAWNAAGSGNVSIRSRAYDDSGNRETPSAGISVTVTNSRTCPCTIINGAATPQNQDDGDPRAVEVGLRFRADVNGAVTGIRFHKGTALNAGTHTGHLWTNTGTLLGSATFTSETATGWQQANFSEAIPITANTTYVASYFAPSGHYSSSGSFLATTGIDNAPLHALKDGTDGANGLYIYGSAATFPTNTYQSEYDWVDVVFDTVVPPDTTAPTITTFFPAASAVNMDPSASVTATFSEAMDPATISSSTAGNEGGSSLGTFELRDPSQMLVTATVTYDAPSRTATLRPQGALALSTTYTVLVKGGGTDPRVKDPAGNAMAANVSWTFTTAATVQPPSGCPCSIWGASVVPSPADDLDGTAVELGTKFRSDLPGFVTGARFYKAVANTGTHTATLWTGTGTQLATATFTAETASGWQQLTFASPVLIAANTTYVISYRAPNGHYPGIDNYFAAGGVDNPPLHALKTGVDGPNGVYAIGSGFPTQTYLSESYFVDVVFNTTTGPDTTAPRVVSVSPFDGASGVRTNTTVSATFNEGVTPASVSLVLRNASNAVVPSTMVYSAATLTVTLTPTSNLAYSSVYTAVVAAGLRDLAGNLMTTDFPWSFTTSAPPPPPPTQGPGGPVLVVTTAANPFSSYYAEILRGEGANEFATLDLAQVTGAVLNSYDVAVLGQTTLTAAQVTMFSNWVVAGGNLIAMRPDKQLAGLLGLTDAASTLANGYLLVNTASAPGAGIVNQTVQFHDAADRYTLNGATAVATLYSNATTATSNPAVTVRTVGSGHAVAFAFDLAKSVVYTRQGNPAWSGQERDAKVPIRSDDLFFGAKAGDVQPDWNDFSKIAIPQADEQQRLLWNVILSINGNRKPLPRFWYFPRMLPAVVVMTGDDHGNNGTAGRFDDYLSLSTPGCSLENWECIRGTSYMYPNTPIGDTVAAAYVAQGFEIGLHLSTNCADYTVASLTGFYNTQLGQFAAAYPHVPAPVTNRTHCIVWSDYATQPQVDLNYNVRLDTSYYYWPDTWVLDRPGMFTGSGMPQRFATASGQMIDVYQAATQMTDESAQTFPKNIDALLNGATGSAGYYGAFTANMHTDANPSPSETASSQIVASAQAHGVPVVSAKQMLDWLDGRNGSSFQSMTFTGNILSFNIAVASGATGLRALVPAAFGSSGIAGVTLNGAAVAYSLQTIKGVQYAVFAANAGAYQVSYGPDITAPVIAAVAASPSVASAVITWTTNEPADSVVTTGTTPSSLSPAGSDPALVTNHAITVTGLTPNTTYYFKVSSADAAGNRATVPAVTPLSFTTNGLILSGTISPAASGSGTLVVATGPTTASTTANSSGIYAFSNLVPGTYTVTASKTGFTLTPPSQPVVLTTASVNGVNFTAQPVVVSGAVIPVAIGAGTVLTLSGPSSATATADSGGNYSFTAVADGSYTLTPSKAGFTFSPTSQTFTVSGASVGVGSFSGQAIPTYSISGTLSPAAIGSGAVVTLGGAGLTTTANAAGGYTFTGLANGTYTVTPAKAGFTFSPANRSVTVNGANVAAVDFAGQAIPTYTISGNVSPAAIGSGTLVTLGGLGLTTTANAAGDYSFTGLSNGSYTVTPSKSGFTFSPASQAVTVNAASVSGVNFTGQAIPTYSLSGTVTPASIGSGTLLTLSGGLTTTANASGAYTFTGLLSGSYTVTPSKTGAAFTPVNRAVTVSSANVTAIDFAGTPTAAPTIDVTASTDRSSASTSLVSPAFTTTAANELILAFISSDNVSGATQVSSVTGGSLTWVLVRRTNAQLGTSEIWRAFATTVLTNAAVTATLSQSVPASITVMTFKGVVTTGTNGSGAIGATASGSSASGAPTASLVTTRASSLVVGVGNDWDNATARTVGAGQTMVHQYLATVGDTFWVQRLTNPVAASGATVTINDTAPTGDQYNLTICEILGGS